MRTHLLAPLLLAVLLAACAPVGSRELHEVVLIDSEGATRLRYVYGSADTLPLDGRDLELGRTAGDAADAAAFGVPGARLVDGAPLLRDSLPADSLPAAVEPPLRVARIPLTTDLRVVTTRAIPRSFYFDGQRWFELPRDLSAGVTVTAVPRPVGTPLRGTSSLTPAEADAVAAGLAEEGRPLVVAALAGDAADGEAGEAASTGIGPRPPGGLDEYRYSAYWVQRAVTTDPDAYRAPARRTVYEVIARGDQGVDPGRDRFVLIDDADELRSFWNAVQAASFRPDAVPEADFGRETVLGVRLSQRPSGGYRIEIVDVHEEGGELFVDVRLVEPAADALATTVVTTPWILVRVLGVDASVVWFRDPDDGALFGVARDQDAPF
ncbi:MAG: protease complex subunit PrcB family protein [Trueperaceae bacterium]|nr:protease complex subunit PrcB family protein [Trueperaceae bacterium]